MKTIDLELIIVDCNSGVTSNYLALGGLAMDLGPSAETRAPKLYTSLKIEMKDLGKGRLDCMIYFDLVRVSMYQS